MFVVKFVFYFILSYMILCIPIKTVPTFVHLNKLTTPYAERFFSFAKLNFAKGIESGRSFGRSLFSNSVPKYQDSVKTTSSALEKRKRRKEMIPQDSYTIEEEEMLRNILK